MHKLTRKRQIRLVATTAAFIILAATALSQTSRPTAPSSTNPEATDTPETNPVQQFISDTKTAIQDAQPGLWHVEHVVDGDTINVTLGDKKETVRFIGIDTPETHDPRKPVQCFGEAAAAHSKALLEGKNVRLEPDPTNSDRDKYRRLLRYVYLPDGTLVNARLIADGYAFAYTIFPFTRLDEFRGLESEARTANRGLWAGCNVDDSKDIKQTTGPKS